MKAYIKYNDFDKNAEQTIKVFAAVLNGKLIDADTVHIGNAVITRKLVFDFSDCMLAATGVVGKFANIACEHLDDLGYTSTYGFELDSEIHAHVHTGDKWAKNKKSVKGQVKT